MSRGVFAALTAALGLVVGLVAVLLGLAGEESTGRGSEISMVMMMIGVSLLFTAVYVLIFRKTPQKYLYIAAVICLIVAVPLIISWMNRLGEPVIGGYEMISIPLLGVVWLPLACYCLKSNTVGQAQRQ